MEFYHNVTINRHGNNYFRKLLWTFITMLLSIDMKIIILENFAISEMKEESFSFEMMY